MTQLALFAPPQELAPLWIQRVTEPGKTIRGPKVKSCDGSVAVVVPVNFVEEDWPWTGRALPVEELRRDFRPLAVRVRAKQ